MRLMMIQHVENMPNFELTLVLVITAAGLLSASSRSCISTGSSGSVSHRDFFGSVMMFDTLVMSQLLRETIATDQDLRIS